MSTLKKIWKFISSMRFAIILLVVLALACSLSSLVTQGQSYAWYAQRYGERTAGLILALRLDDAFHSWWFIAINGFLCLNLLLCNLIRLPRPLRRVKAEGDMAFALRGSGDISVEGVVDPVPVFERLRLPKPREGADEAGRPALFAGKNRAGLWGAWVCHLGILLLILGFGLGQMTQWKSAVYGVPGQTMPVGDTGYVARIDDFRVDRRPDGSVEQYTTDITLISANSSGPGGGSASVSVNNPATLCGMKFYQNSTGWAAKLTVYEGGEPLQEAMVCAGEYLRVADKPDLVIYLNALYPDYVLRPGAGPATASDELNNPAYLYSVYYQDQIIGMNALLDGEVLTIDDYTVTFTEPQLYTLLQVKADHFTWLALLGGMTTLLGLVLAFYVQPEKAWAVRGADGLWTVYGANRKGGAIFRERFLRAAGMKGTTDGEENENAAG